MQSDVVNASNDFYATCVQVILLCWLILGVETSFLKLCWQLVSWRVWLFRVWCAATALASVVSIVGACVVLMYPNVATDWHASVVLGTTIAMVWSAICAILIKVHVDSRAPNPAATP